MQEKTIKDKSNKRPKRKNNTREDSKKILKAAAIRQIDKVGISKISMRSIAAEANMTTGSIYYCYKNKQELFEDIISDSIHFTHRIFQEYELEKKPQYDLLSDVEKEARLRLKHKQEEKLYIMLLASALNKDSGYRKNYMKSLQTVTAQAGELFSHIYGIDNSTLPEQFASIFMAALDGVAIQQLYNALPTDESAYTDTLIDFFKECVPLYISKHSGDN